MFRSYLKAWRGSLNSRLEALNVQVVSSDLIMAGVEGCGRWLGWLLLTAAAQAQHSVFPAAARAVLPGCRWFVSSLFHEGI